MKTKPQQKMVEMPQNSPGRADEVFAAANAYIAALIKRKPAAMKKALAEWERVADKSEVKNEQAAEII
ncbi:hypothetical protein MASR1M12_00830 [Erysipelotrichia bacterium]